MAHKAPGKHYRAGLTLIELTRMFPDDAVAEHWFVKTRWPGGVHCPCCGSLNVQERETRKPQPYRCRDCRKDFSVKLGTLMEGSKLGFQTWAMAIYLMMTGLKGTSSMKLHRDLGVTQKTAWHLAHRIRRNVERPGVALCWSGPRLTKPSSAARKRTSTLTRSSGAGRGTVGKAIVIGAKDRETNRVSAVVVEGTDAKTLQGFVGDRAAKGATVYTDDHGGYQGMPFEHETVKHSISEYVNGMAHTNGIESFWSMLKRGYHGTLPSHEREAPWPLRWGIRRASQQPPR